MERIGVRELRQDASRYLERVRAGERIEVTVRGDLVALLVPPDPSTTDREALLATGRLIPASRTLRFPERLPARANGPDTAAALDELRDDRT